MRILPTLRIEYPVVNWYFINLLPYLLHLIAKLVLYCSMLLIYLHLLVIQRQKLIQICRHVGDDELQLVDVHALDEVNQDLEELKVLEPDHCYHSVQVGLNHHAAELFLELNHFLCCPRLFQFFKFELRVDPHFLLLLDGLVLFEELR